MSATLVAWAALGGGVGAVARYLVDAAVKARHTGAFPLATWLINVTGALLLGLLSGLGHTHPQWPSGLVVLLGTGVLGGYTTFSTASHETVRLARAGRWILAAGYSLASLLVAVVVAALGWVVGSGL